MMDILTPSEIRSTDPLIEGRRDWPEESIYRYDRGGHELIRVVRVVKAAVAAAVVGDPVELALVIDGPLVIVCSKVGEALPWAGASFHWHRVRRSERILPPSGADTSTGSRIDLKLMMARGGRVRATRPLTIPVDFSRVLHEAILEQARFTYDPGEERRSLESLLRRCPTPGSLVGYATVKATLAG